eukprot:INCI576.1.p1 GENE.INCI576.1~~INCI576.1.p1  ORF type:complete len:879 (+),score=195.02 INCI576.1:158-2794(+)
MSAIREVMKELEQYKLLAEEGARAKAKCERLADEMRDFENCRRDLALAHETVRDLRGQVAVAEERAAAAVEARNEALEQKNATDKELNLKTFALKRSQKVGQFERRTNEGMMKKNTALKDQLEAEKRDHALTHRNRTAAEEELEQQRKDAARERELRLLGMHRHQLVVREGHERMQELAHLPKALEQTQHSLRLVKENNTVLATAIGVEKGVQEAMDEYMDEAAKEIQKLRARLRTTEEQREEARNAHSALVESYKELQAFTDALQYHLISTGAHEGPNHQVMYSTGPNDAGRLMAASDARAALLRKRPKAPFPLGRDWGHGENNLKHHQLPTYTSMVRMRGKSPEEVVEIMTENVRDAENELEEGTKKKEELAFKAEKSKLRCEMLQTRLLDKKIKRGRIAAQAAEEKRKLDTATKELNEARKVAVERRAAFLKRRNNEEAERDPYRTPYKIRNHGLTQLQLADQAAKLVQAAFRANKTRKQLEEENLELQVDLETKIPEFREKLADLERVLGEFDTDIAEMEEQVAAQQKEKAKLAADHLREEQSGVPELELALKRRRAALQRAIAEKQRNDVDMTNRAPDMLHSTVIRAATAPVSDAHGGAGGAQALSYGALASKVDPHDHALMQRNIVAERQWRGGGGGAPRGTAARHGATAAYVSPMLPPPRWRRKQRQDAAVARLAEVAAAQDVEHGVLAQITNSNNQTVSGGSGPQSRAQDDAVGLYMHHANRSPSKRTQQLALTASHPLLLSAEHSPATLKSLREEATGRGAQRSASNALRKLDGHGGPASSQWSGKTTIAKQRRGPRSHPAPTELSGSLNMGKGLRMRKILERDVNDEVQSRLAISTRGSTRQILARVRQQLDGNRHSKNGLGSPTHRK